jgi:hypothetical protein
MDPRAHKIGCVCSKTWAIVNGQWAIVVNGPVPDCPQHGVFARTGTPYDLDANDVKEAS